MKYFTYKLLQDISCEDEQIRERAEAEWRTNDEQYVQQLDIIREHIPDFWERISFHDMDVLSMFLYSINNSIQLRIHLHDGKSIYILTFFDVSEYSLTTAENNSCPSYVHNGLFRWLYQELELLPNGLHIAILFDDGREMQLVFKDAKLELEPTSIE